MDSTRELILAAAWYQAGAKKERSQWLKTLQKKITALNRTDEARRASRRKYDQKNHLK
jgi:hypothetical protein